MIILLSKCRFRLNSLLFAIMGFCAAIGVQSLTQGHPVQASTYANVSFANLVARLNADEATIAALKSKTAPINVSGTDLTFTGVNVHIVSGSGSTSDGTVDSAMDSNEKAVSGKSLTGLGNLIIGYNTPK